MAGRATFLPSTRRGGHPVQEAALLYLGAAVTGTAEGLEEPLQGDGHAALSHGLWPDSREGEGAALLLDRGEAGTALRAGSAPLAQAAHLTPHMHPTIGAAVHVALQRHRRAVLPGLHQRLYQRGAGLIRGTPLHASACIACLCMPCTRAPLTAQHGWCRKSASSGVL